MNTEILMDAKKVKKNKNLALSPEEIQQKLKKISEKEILGSGDLLIVLQICSKTLYRWRKQGIIKFSKIANKYYYLWSDILPLLNRAV